jgi:hypothetical protein
MNQRSAAGKDKAEDDPQSQTYRPRPSGGEREERGRGEERGPGHGEKDRPAPPAAVVNAALGACTSSCSALARAQHSSTFQLTCAPYVGYAGRFQWFQ